MSKPRETPRPIRHGGVTDVTKKKDVKKEGKSNGRSS